MSKDSGETGLKEVIAREIERRAAKKGERKPGEG